MTLAPGLTPLDHRVLMALPLRPRTGIRVEHVFDRLAPSMRRDTSVEEVRLILRGLEHLGKCEQRGGWWRR